MDSAAIQYQLMISVAAQQALQTAGAVNGLQWLLGNISMLLMFVTSMAFLVMSGKPPKIPSSDIVEKDLSIKTLVISAVLLITGMFAVNFLLGPFFILLYLLFTGIAGLFWWRRKTLFSRDGKGPAKGWLLILSVMYIGIFLVFNVLPSLAASEDASQNPVSSQPQLLHGNSRR